MKIRKIISNSLIIIGLSFIVFQLFFENYISNMEIVKIPTIPNKKILNDKIMTLKNININNSTNYTAILYIPSIKLTKGLVSYKAPQNSIDNNIEVLSIPSKKNNSSLILAAHSGNSNISFFRNIHNLKINDKILIYHNNNKYIYKVTNYFTINKNGFIDISNYNKNNLILTTCKGRKKQLIVVSDLLNIVHI